jgi:ATP-dependent protease HslVU (ClpYQ) peptidase subunit
MTVIIGCREGNNVWVGADSCGSRGDGIRDVSLTPKVFTRPVPPDDKDGQETRLTFQMVFGITDSWRMGQLMQHRLEIPPHYPELDAIEYLFLQFVPAVRECLNDGGWATKKDEHETGGLFMLGYRGKLVTIEPDYHVQERAAPYCAIGSGYEVALGALATLEEIAPGISPEQKIEIALRAAAEHSVYVMRPFTIAWV